jgi:cell division FtsZ-interacting protein ZapD
MSQRLSYTSTAPQQVQLDTEELQAVVSQLQKAESELSRNRGLTQQLSSEMSSLWNGLALRMETLASERGQAHMTETGLYELADEVCLRLWLPSGCCCFCLGYFANVFVYG